MSSERQDRIDEIFQAAVDLPTQERDAFVARECAGDAELGRAVDSLLGSHVRAHAAGFMDDPVFRPTAGTTADDAFGTPTGGRIGRYRVLDEIGRGGMGVVFLAEDESLDRRVALKLLTGALAADDQRARRFRQEALAASALNHPNIITIHEIGAWEHGGFIATEFIEGSTLRRVIDGRPLALARALDIAAQIARALSAAHGAGIVHRDVKPENVMVRPDGLVKVLDFGIAKSTGDGAAAREAAVGTRTGAVVGTAAYMAPEQARGLSTDARTDLWSFGCVLYEMLAGRPAFGGETASDTLAAVLEHDPDWGALPATVPARVRRLLERCLAKDHGRRLGDASAARAEVENALATAVRTAAAAADVRRRWFAGAAVLLVIAGLAGWAWRREAGPRWARNVALPEIVRLVDREDFYGAYLLAQRAQAHVPDHPALRRFFSDHTFPLTLETTPADAQVSMKPYRAVDAGWQPLGRTPFKEMRVPFANLRLRIEKGGFEPIEVASDFSGPMRVRRFTLDPAGQAPKGMVRVPGGPYQYLGMPPVHTTDFWFDRYEVTNREFEAFVKQGGYRNRSYWKEAFVRDGRVLAWEEALGQFRDATGRPGPATWEFGTYPEGRGDHPVSGVSWFEAAAYAVFAGKELPTVHHWMRAAGLGHFADILLLSNFGGQRSAPIGSHHGLSAFGAYDVAGNVKEWCANAYGAKRYILGGGWNEPSYVFADADAQSPWDRLPNYGFRGARYVSAPPPEQKAPVDLVMRFRHYAVAKPVTDEVFEVYRSFYTYDRTALEAAVESVEESEHWRREKVSYDAAYGRERVPAFLFLPRNARPPYQTVVYWPGGEATVLRSSADIRLRFIEYVLRSGRAVLHPVYKGTYERRTEGRWGPAGRRDLVIQMSKDLGRSLDYLETRPDIDAGKFAFYGVSLGGDLAPPFLAVEPRFKTAVLQGGGLGLVDLAPEISPVNFAPRVTLPVLMVNGRLDFVTPLDTSQRPLFRLLGTPEPDKRHVLFEGGHSGYDMHDLFKVVLDWLDRYLGPVSPP
jgi:dienelactone hydrolase